MPHIFCLDFETQAIDNRPAYPPEPVGVAITQSPLGSLTIDAEYLAWGHPTNNNTDANDGRRMLQLNWPHGRQWPDRHLLMHNAAFDLAVAHEKLVLPIPDGTKIHDTMVLAFLLDPYGELSLKPLAHQCLGIPPTERDAVRDWLYDNNVISRRIKKWGAYIAKAPGDLVGKYAVGDVTRTVDLFNHLYPRVVSAGMESAYQREMQIMPMLLENSAQGIPLDRKRLKRDTAHYEAVLVQLDKDINASWRKEVGHAPPEDLDNPTQLAEALSLNKRIELPRTATGRLSTAKETLLEALPNWRIKALLLYRSALVKTLSTYMRPWVDHGDNLHCSWNQVRDYSDAGARTGRLSSSPNMQNITNPETYDALAALMVKCKCANADYVLPNLRSYLIAPKGHVLFSRDYSQQELRFLAHYEDGELAQAYRDDPSLDIHDHVQSLIRTASGIELGRKPTKTINFGKIYGMGAPTLSAKLDISYDEAQSLIGAYDRALPSVKQLQRELQGVGRRGEEIRTIGGRRYFAPPPAIDKDGSTRTFEYKLLNYLIQGSSGDQTKEAMRLWHREIKGTDTRFLMTIHDQLVGCAPKSKVAKASDTLDACMRGAFTLDVPVRTDPTYGMNFGEMKKELP